MRRLLAAAALAGIALFMLTGYLASDLDKGSAVALAALALVVGLPAAGAALLVRSHLRTQEAAGSRREALRQQNLESEILRLALEHGGRLTAVEVAAHIGLAPEGAREALEQLALRGQAEYEVTDQGVIVYSFHDIRHLGSKDSARGILDA